MINEQPLTREQKISLSGIIGDRLVLMIDAFRKDWDIAWEKRAKIAQQVDTLDEEIKKLDARIKELIALKDALSW